MRYIGMFQASFIIVRSDEDPQYTVQSYGGKTQFTPAETRGIDNTSASMTCEVTIRTNSPPPYLFKPSCAFLHRQWIISATLPCNRSSPRHMRQAVQRLTSPTRGSVFDRLLRYPIIRRYSSSPPCTPLASAARGCARLAWRLSTLVDLGPRHSKESSRHLSVFAGRRPRSAEAP